MLKFSHLFAFLRYFFYLWLHYLALIFFYFFIFIFFIFQARRSEPVWQPNCVPAGCFSVLLQHVVDLPGDRWGGPHGEPGGGGLRGGPGRARRPASGARGPRQPDERTQHVRREQAPQDDVDRTHHERGPGRKGEGPPLSAPPHTPPQAVQRRCVANGTDQSRSRTFSAEIRFHRATNTPQEQTKDFYC